MVSPGDIPFIYSYIYIYIPFIPFRRYTIQHKYVFRWRDHKAVNAVFCRKLQIQRSSGWVWSELECVYWVFAGVSQTLATSLPPAPKSAKTTSCGPPGRPGQSPDMARGRFSDLLFNGKIVLFSFVIQFCPSLPAILPPAPSLGNLPVREFWIEMIWSLRRSVASRAALLHFERQRRSNQKRVHQTRLWGLYYVFMIMMWSRQYTSSLITAALEWPTPPCSSWTPTTRATAPVWSATEWLYAFKSIKIKIKIKTKNHVTVPNLLIQYILILRIKSFEQI